MCLNRCCMDNKGLLDLCRLNVDIWTIRIGLQSCCGSRLLFLCEVTLPSVVTIFLYFPFVSFISSQSLNLGGRRGTTDDVATIPLFLVLFASPISKAFSRIFDVLPFYCLPAYISWKIYFDFFLSFLISGSKGNWRWSIRTPLHRQLWILQTFSFFFSGYPDQIPFTYPFGLSSGYHCQSSESQMLADNDSSGEPAV